MTTHILSMTYQPKVEGVRNGTIRQTIRKFNEKRPFKVGDKLLIHGWAGKPYRSPWSWRMEAEVQDVMDMYCSAERITVRIIPATGPFAWVGLDIDGIAEKDGVLPPTEAGLKQTLEKFHGKFTDEPVRFQVIRW